MLPQRLVCTMTGIFRLLRSILSVTKDAEHDAAARSDIPSRATAVAR